MRDLTVNRFRTARGRVLRQQIAQLSAHLGRPIVILDVGGRAEYWKNVGLDNISQVRLLNNDPGELTTDEGKKIFVSEVGDARALDAYADKSVDLLHSNSVIEHVGDWDDMAAMAREAQRVGLSGWVQTPAWSFPIEPHFKLPFLHWFASPIWRSILRMSSDYGTLNLQERRHHVDRINLLTRSEFQVLFPNSNIFNERLIFVKSYSARWMPSDVAGSLGLRSPAELSAA